MAMQLKATVINSDRLPELPPDPRGEDRHVSHVVCAQAPGFHYKEHFIPVIASWVDGRVAAFNAHKESKPGWIAPVQIGHVDTGLRQGDFFKLTSAMIGRVVDSKDGGVALDWDDIVLTLLACVAWTDPDAEANIKAHKLTHVSIGIERGIQRPDTGETLRGVPNELTQSAGPHIGQAAILNEAVKMAQDTTPAPPPKPEEEEEEVKAAVDPMTELRDMMAQILALLMPSEPAPAPELTSVEAQLVKVEALLVAAEKRADDEAVNARRVAFDSTHPEGGTIKASAEILDILFAASETAPESVVSIKAAYVAATPEAQAKLATTPTLLRRINPWRAEGRKGSGDVNDPPPESADEELTITCQAIDAEATTDGVIDHNKAMTIHKGYRSRGYKITKEEVSP